MFGAILLTHETARAQLSAFGFSARPQPDRRCAALITSACTAAELPHGLPAHSELAMRSARRPTML